MPGRPPAWQRRWHRHRRLAAAVLAGLVVWSGLQSVHPPAAVSREVVTAQHDLTAGTTLTAGDVAVASRPVDALAGDAVDDPGDVVGRVVTTPVLAGESLRGRDVAGRGLIGSLGPGLVATTVRLSDDAGLTSVRPGDLVDLIAARGGDGSGAATASVVAARVRVLAVASPSSSGSGLLGGGTSAAPVLLVASTSQQALDIAAALVASRLSLVLRGD